MAKVRDILARKGTQVQTISQTATVLEATLCMNDHKIGGLVVTQEGRIVGIFTERDVLRRIVAEQRSPSQTRVQDVMTCDVLCCTPDMDLDEAARIMMDRRIRHLPVCGNEGQLLGLISIGDLNAHRASDQEAQIHILNDYLYSHV